MSAVPAPVLAAAPGPGAGVTRNLSSFSVAQIAQPHLEDLAEELHESCSVSVLDGDDIVYVARASANRIMTIALTVGTRLPPYPTSMGRVLLAGLPEAELDAHLSRARLRKLTEHTVDDPDQLRAILADVRAKGWAAVDQELEAGGRPVDRGADPGQFRPGGRRHQRQRARGPGADAQAGEAVPAPAARTPPEQIDAELASRMAVGGRVRPLGAGRSGRPGPPAGATAAPRCGLAPDATGTVTPASASSVRGAARVSTSPRPGAAASRAVSDGRPQRCCTVLSIDVWSSGVVPAGHPEHRARRDQRRDQHRRDPDAEPGEVEAELAGGVVRRRRARRRRHVVVAAAVLVVGDDQQRLRPAGPAADRLVDVVDELLAEGHVVVRVLAVAGRAPARLEERERGQRAGRRGGLEVGELADGCRRRRRCR